MNTSNLMRLNRVRMFKKPEKTSMFAEAYAECHRMRKSPVHPYSVAPDMVRQSNHRAEPNAAPPLIRAGQGGRAIRLCPAPSTFHMIAKTGG